MLQKIQKQLDEGQCLIVTDKHNIRYALGTEISGYLFITKEDAELLASNFYRYEEIEVEKQFYSSKNQFEQILEKKAEKYQDLEVTADRKNKLLEENFDLKVSSLVTDLRKIKSSKEVEKIREAVEVTEKAFNRVEDTLFEGFTEREVVEEIEKVFREENAYDSFIENGGTALVHRNCLRPHRRPENEVVKDDDIVIVDIGAEVDGYCADMTRTYFENPSEERKKLYRDVKEIRNELIKFIEPGMKVSEIRGKEVELLKDKGYSVEENLIHSTGHGIGLQVHEAPSINSSSEEILKPGMVIALEPALYVEDVGGVRLEDDFLVKPEDIEKLSNLKHQ